MSIALNKYCDSYSLDWIELKNIFLLFSNPSNLFNLTKNIF